MSSYGDQLKKKITMARIAGLITAAVGVAAIFFYFYKLVQPWFCVILLAYCMAMCFMINSTYQELKVGRFFCILNLICAVIFFIATILIIVFSFISGGIRI